MKKYFDCVIDFFKGVYIRLYPKAISNCKCPGCNGYCDSNSFPILQTKDKFDYFPDPSISDRISNSLKKHHRGKKYVSKGNGTNVVLIDLIKDGDVKKTLLTREVMSDFRISHKTLVKYIAIGKERNGFLFRYAAK